MRYSTGNSTCRNSRVAVTWHGSTISETLSFTSICACPSPPPQSGTTPGRVFATDVLDSPPPRRGSPRSDFCQSSFRRSMHLFEVDERVNLLRDKPQGRMPLLQLCRLETRRLLGIFMVSFVSTRALEPRTSLSQPLSQACAQGGSQDTILTTRARARFCFLANLHAAYTMVMVAGQHFVHCNCN